MPRLVRGPGRDRDADPSRSRADRRVGLLIPASRTHRRERYNAQSSTANIRRMTLAERIIPPRAYRRAHNTAQRSARWAPLSSACRAGSARLGHRV
ncbi:hypothetical protein NDU88_005067 [Pleurodeles waltl]|uniref:Uncharacterized protein n=1 Tax=Pleurodeles waltl TaxID=8319 RepID=A0AAV7TBG3_PLEWA|nr:hypothetical protein NDU88_005067 [Pleurodeles waltl]